MELLSSLTEMSAAEGFPIVLLGALQAFGALALIIAVLLVMDKVYKKKHTQGADNEDSASDEQTENANGTGDTE